MGGLGGHLNHLYDDRSMTLKEVEEAIKGWKK